jgi:YtxH-like protein
MASQPSKTADELTTAIRSLVDKALESQTREQIAARGREVAAALAETAGTAAERASEIANEVWRDSAPQRRDAMKSADRMRKDAFKWSRKAWLKQLQPALRNAWSRRAAAIGAASLAVPASRELVDQARIRLGIRQREERRWRFFFLGLVIGAIGGAIAALLTAPRPGREVRDELASRAREAATSAGDWVPIFQREGVDSAPVSQSGSMEGSAAVVADDTSLGADRPARPRKRAPESSEMTPLKTKGNGADAPASPSTPEIDHPEGDAI